MVVTSQWRIVSIEPAPRMPDNVGREFTLTIEPEGAVTDVFSQRPAFAKVRGFEVESTAGGRVVLKVTIVGMRAGTLNVPFTVEIDQGEVEFVIRLVG